MISPLESKLREDLCEAARRLYAAGFMSGSDGNLSAILTEGEILITPSRLSKGYLEPGQIVKVDPRGNKLAGEYSPTSEMAVHLACYQERPDICAVAHCHPPIITAFTVAGRGLPENILPEIELLFGGRIPLAPYASPGGSALADTLRAPIRNRATSVVLMDHHGLVAVGNDIFQAAIRAEHAEAAARVIYYAEQLGGAKPLSPENVSALHQSHQALAEKESGIFTGYCHVCAAKNGQEAPLTSSTIEGVVRRVMQEMVKELG